MFRLCIHTTICHLVLFLLPTIVNLTASIPEKHNHSANDSVELNGLNITASFLGMDTEKNASLLEAVKDQTPGMLFDYPELSSSLNKTLNPCENFYEFVCNGWKQKHPTDENNNFVNQYQQINNFVEDRIKSILDDRSNFLALPPYDEMLFNLYDSCMDNASRLQAGSTHLLSKLKSLEQKKDNNITDWLIQAWPTTLFYQVLVWPDLRNSTRNILTIAPYKSPIDSVKALRTPLEYFIEQLELKVYRKQLAKLMELLYADDHNQTIFKQSSKKADIKRRVESFIYVKTEMAKIINDTGENYDNPYADEDYMDLQEFQDNLAGTVNWTRYMQSVMPAEVLLKRFPNGLSAAEIRIMEMRRIKKFEQLTRNLSNQVLSDYMDWKVILDHLPELDYRYLEIGTKLGIRMNAAKWTECKNLVVDYFGKLLERVYINKFMDETTRGQMQKIVQNVKQSFLEMLDQNEGVDALEKLYSMKIFIRNMDSIFNDTILKKQFSEYAISPGQPFTQIMASVSNLAYQNYMLLLLEPYEEDFSSLSINAHYNQNTNSIALSGAILQGAFFNASFPLPMNYGGTGFTIAHEIMHAFGPTGRLHDHAGNVRDWWNDKAHTALQQQKQCFVHQYSTKYMSEGLLRLSLVHSIENTGKKRMIDGNLTLDENIADNVGIRAAYIAMRKALEVDPQAAQQKIRCIEEFNAEQLFFINYAFGWCYNLALEAALSDVVTKDNHAPAEARVNLVLGNMPEFAEQFNCPVGTPMHPAKRCQVW